MKLLKACIVLSALAALFVVPSVASASPELTCHTGTICPAGTLITATNVEHDKTVTTTKMTSSIGVTVECTTATMTGKILTNSGTHIEGEISAASFSGTAGVTPHTPHCSGGSLGSVTVDTNPTHNGLASIPWCITANTLDDKFTVTGKCGTKNPIVFTLTTSIVGACTYSAPSVTGTYTTHPADAILTVTNQEFTRVTGSSFCPSWGKLHMAFTLETDNGNKEPLYIS